MSSSVVASTREGVSLRTVKVNTKGGKYDVVVGRGICTSPLFKELVSEVCTDEKQRVTKFFVFVDANLLGLNSALVTIIEVALASIVGGDNVNLMCIHSGEASKCRDQKAEIEDFLSRKGADRRAVLVALGGGVIGDLIGFVAASYYRGIRFIQVPTTVLSMVDSSVGGKTAVDTQFGKNLIGAFWQPILVVADIAFLDTLPVRQVRSGIAEIIKAGMCARPELFAELESLLSSKGVEGLVQDYDEFRHVIVAGIDYKRSVVEEDERDKGLRNELNWGHTVGHAIEGMGVTGLHHGECVSIGMVYEAMALRAQGQLSNIAAQRLEKVLKCCDLPTVLPPGAEENREELMRRMKRDKKNRGGAIHVVDVRDIGRCEGDSRTVPVPDRILKRVLSSAVTISGSALVKSGQKLGPSGGGVLELPGSKSISNRALVLAALAEKPGGKCRVFNLTPSEDIRVMLAALSKLGVDVKYLSEGPESGLNVELRCPGGSLTLSPDTSKAGVTTVWVENAGTVARFITPLLGYLVATCKDPSVAVVVDGNDRMRVRPVEDLVNCMQRAFKGVRVDYVGPTQGCLPLKITKARKRSVADASEGSQTSSGFPCGTVDLSSKVSSQFVSGMLLVSSLARGGEEEGFTLRLEDTRGGKAVSQPYIDMTCRVMEEFGVKALPETDSDGRLYYKVAAGQKLVAPGTYRVEADASAASYPLAIAAATGCEITVNLPYQSLGSRPVQGETLFVSKILKPMGCQVERHEEGWTTVKGPPGGKLKARGTVDMSDLTDSFLTAAVLMALAEGESCITNVANQRVKECDRIAAMAENINLCFHSKVAEERPDGLVIHGGSPVVDGLQSVTTDSHDDHRVAMAIAVLATRFPSEMICISQPRCVEKTFSDFWDVLELQLGIPVSAAPDENRCEGGYDDVAMDGAGGLSPPRKVFLIGMRNCGKTSIGRELASAIGWRFLDMDAELERSLGVTLSQFVKEKGWKEFRRVEVQLLQSVLQGEEERCIISCGGGIVEMPQAVSILGQQRYVVWLRMDEDDVVAANTGPDGKPAYGEPVEDVYRRRRDKFAEASKYEVHLPRRPAGVEQLPAHVASCRSMAVRILQSWLNRLDRLGEEGRPPLPEKYSTFTCLTLPTYEGVTCRDGDLDGTSAVEVRLDLLKDPGDCIRQLQYASTAAGKLPVIATLRSSSEGGQFDESDELYWDFVKRVSRSCCVSYVDIEISRCSESSFPAPVIGVGYVASRHFLRPPTGGRLEVCRAFDEVLQPWWSAVGKVVFTASSESDATLITAVQEEKLQGTSKPLVGLCMGPRGVISRIMNPYWTPVRHPAMKAAAPGQLSLMELKSMREALNIGMGVAEKTARRYFVFGSPVTKSPSPALHNHIFKTFGLPHEYSRFDTAKVEEVLSVMAGEDFGGASITIPLKEKVFAAVADGTRGKVSELASAAQAVNTIVKHDDGSLSFHNTDTLALAESIRTKAALASTCLVVGTGGAARGACAAAELLGMDKIYVWGRDATKAANLAEDFENGEVCPSEPGNDGFDVIIGCVPAQDSQMWPTWWFSKDTLILEMAYIPQKTPLTRAAEDQGCRNIVYGLEILVMQGIEQSMQWTGMPREAFGNDVYAPVVQFYAQSNQ